MKINEVVKMIRLKTNLSQMAFAEQIGVSFSTINRWENGKASPNRLAIRAIKAFAYERNISEEIIKLLN